jgi:hypothetical protein
MKLITLILSFTFGLTTVANASSFANRDAWVKVGSDYQEAYLLGLYEGVVNRTSGDSRAAIKWKKKVGKCMVDMNATTATLTDMIDNYYSDVGNWKNNVTQGLYDSLHKACGKD